MDITRKQTLLGGLSARQFMRRHWHKKPLVIRQAIPGIEPLLSRAELFDLAAREDVESRLVAHDAERKAAAWTLRKGPLPRRALPPVSRREWSVLVQGVDLHSQAVHELLQQFRFVPDARVDDLMISWASDGGGVGPHFDSYDVFLLQVAGRRRWRIGRLEGEPELLPDAPLKILRHFDAEEEHVLEPGDMLYLPPRWAHDGVAEGECMTYSIGFRAPRRAELAREVLVRQLEAMDPGADAKLYRDPRQDATERPGDIPAELQRFARDAVQALLQDETALQCALGEYLSEPKSDVRFEPGDAADLSQGVRLDRRTRMMYDARHIFINGEAYRAAGRDATLVRRLADERCLGAQQMRSASDEARALLEQWADDGWIHPL